VPDIHKLETEPLAKVMMFYPHIGSDKATFAFVPEGSKISRRMAQRLSDAYNVATERFAGQGGSFWEQNDERNADLIAALRSGDLDTISAIANDPGQHNLFWGIDGLTKGYAADKNTPVSSLTLHALLLADCIVRLAEAVGATPLWYPEAHRHRTDGIDIEQTLDAIERKIGRTIDFPNPFPNESGIRTSRGIGSYRTFQAIYQAWRLLCLSKAIGPRIVEIGPGLGRTAYYARKFKLPNYTTIDLPIGNIAQACFLCRALGENAIALPGERADAGQVRIETPAWFMSTEERFDIVLNADSLTEMALDHAEVYAQRAVKISRVFVSINHEINLFKTRNLSALKGISGQRFPYWMRKGYVEEIYLITPPRVRLPRSAFWSAPTRALSQPFRRLKKLYSRFAVRMRSNN
jgi:hypothetical protein